MKTVVISFSIVALLLSCGCAPKKWTKKDPGTANMTIEDSIEIGVGAGLSPTATATP